MTLAFPSIVPNQVTWHLEANTAVFVSPFTRTTQTLEMAGARWVTSLSFPPMRSATWRTYSAWLAKMRGQSGRVYFGPPHYTGSTAPSWTPDPSAITCDNATVKCDSTTETVDQTSESAWGTPVVYGAGQSGAVLDTTGWVNDVTVLMAGDYISYDTTYGRTLHMVVEDAVSDSAGRSSITVEPPIRNAPDDAAAVETESPTCIMALADSMSGAMSIAPFLRASVSLDMVEAF